jgi:hypothetical protein
MTDPDQTNTVPADDAAMIEQGTPGPDVPPGAGLRYAVLRLVMLITVGGVLYLVGMRGWALLFAAVIVSAIASYFVFMRQREAAARNLEAKVAARAARRHPEATSAAGPEDEKASPADSEG